MKLSNTFASRPAIFDRNPLQIWTANYDNNAAPAGFTQRWAYTVPSSRKAIVETALARMHRVAVATTPSNVEAHIRILNGANEIRFMHIRWEATNVQDDHREDFIGNGPILLPGDQLQAYTLDLSTAGTISFKLGCAVLEFDA